jgi:ketosteroid isomerase-like protein
MSQENVEIVRRIYEAWATGDFRARVGDLDRHVVLVIGPDFPEVGVFVGPEGIRDYMHRFLDQWERFKIEANQLRGGGRHSPRGSRPARQRKGKRDRGRQPLLPALQLSGGRIVRMESIMSEREALEAAGLSEE